MKKMTDTVYPYILSTNQRRYVYWCIELVHKVFKRGKGYHDCWWRTSAGR